MQDELIIFAIAGGIVAGLLNYPPFLQSLKYGVAGALIGFFAYHITALIPVIHTLPPDALVFVTACFSSTILINANDKINNIIKKTNENNLINSFFKNKDKKASNKNLNKDDD